MEKGIIVHVSVSKNIRYSKVSIYGKETEITVFDGCFENMLTDHNEIPCIGIIVGHYNLHSNFWIHHANGFIKGDDFRKTYVVGIAFSCQFHISDKDASLTKMAVDEFIKNLNERSYKTMDYRKINKSVMDDTQDLCGKLNALKNAVVHSVQNEYVVYQDESIAFDSAREGANTKIIVSQERTYQAAEKYKGKKICCLDFANNHSIGGAPWSAGAQEESMCRTSTLYPCLYAKKREFYDKHILEYEERKIDEMGSDDLIYIPDVVVFKTDESVPKLKDEEQWFKTDVIVCAAPQLRLDYDESAFRKIMTSRIKRILDVAAKEKVEVLILGAFGCGAFHNPPEVVADIFASLVKNYNFETVEFAVFCRDDTTNYDVFKARFFGDE